MKNLNLRFILSFCIFLASSHTAWGQSADEILRKADEIRAPSQSYLMEVSVDSNDAAPFRFSISIGGKDSSVIRTLAPSREVGKNYLMVAEDMWAYIPNIRRAIRVTLNQKLTGQAANGDISRMRWYGDYNAEIEKEDTKSWTLMLTAKKQGLTYDKIRVRIDKNTFRPIDGSYLTKQGRSLKHVSFDDYKQIAGAVRPTKIMIRSADNKNHFSILRILKMKQATFPSSLFTQTSLR